MRDKMSPQEDNERPQFHVVQSETFRRWLRKLADTRALARIVVRIDRLAEGNFGDHKSVGRGVAELRIDVGKGYRVYYTTRDQMVVVLLCGGDKSSQRHDIARPQRMASEI